MRGVWRGDAVVEGVPPIGPTPVQPGGPPILTASMGPKSLARSARWADGLSGFDLAPDPDSVVRTFDAVRSAWADAGRARRPCPPTPPGFPLGEAPARRPRGMAPGGPERARATGSPRTRGAIRVRRMGFTFPPAQGTIRGWPTAAPAGDRQFR